MTDRLDLPRRYREQQLEALPHQHVPNAEVWAYGSRVNGPSHEDSEWQSVPFSEAVLVNPPVRLQRGTEYPFVDMAAVNPGSRFDTAFYVVPAAENMSQHFLLYALDGQGLPSVAADSAVPGLNRNLAYMNRQLVPNRIVVDAFGDHAATIFTRRYRLEEESRALSAQRNALLPKLVSGEKSERE